MRPFTFTASAAPGIVSVEEVKNSARLAESIGFGTIVFQDHLVKQHAPIPLLTAVAAFTEKIRICTYVLNVDLRHPAVVAQDLGSLDVLSGGRLIVGLGGGWSQPEYRAIGIPFEPVAVRTARVRESLTVLRGCFADGPFSFTGDHYQISDHDGQPKPVQRPHPPFLIGGGGKTMLTLAGQEANIIGLAPRLPPGRPGGVFFEPASITVAASVEKVGWVRAAAGDRFDQLEISTHSSGWPVMVTNNARAEAQRRIDDIRQRIGVELTVDELLESPHVWVGTIEQLTEKCLFLRERVGISNFMVGHPHELAGVVENLAGR